MATDKTDIQFKVRVKHQLGRERYELYTSFYGTRDFAHAVAAALNHAIKVTVAEDKCEQSATQLRASD